MDLQLANAEYQWIEDWIVLPDCENGWAHHGMALLADNTIVTGHSTYPIVYFVTPEGQIEKYIELNAAEIHHIAIKTSGETETLLISDIGDKQLIESRISVPKVIEIDRSGQSTLCQRLLRQPGPFDGTAESCASQ